MVLISRKQRDFNDDLGAYLEGRTLKKNGSSDSNSFFKKVDSLIPIRKKNGSKPNEVPMLSDAVESTVYEEDKPSFFSRVIAFFNSPSSSNVDDLDEDVEELSEDIKEDIHEMEDEIKEIDHEVEDLEEKREGLLKRFFNSLFGSRKPELEEEVEFEHNDDVELNSEEVLKAETRQTLKIIHKWISRLPPEQIDAFKRSPDFIRYKELLDKYGLIR